MTKSEKGRRAKPGRRPLPDCARRKRRLMVSFTEDEWLEVQASADEDDRPMAVWVRRAALERVRGGPAHRNGSG